MMSVWLQYGAWKSSTNFFMERNLLWRQTKSHLYQSTGNILLEISPRIQRLVVRSFPYQPFNVQYRKGVEIPLADALSRVTPLPMEEDGIQLPIITVNLVTANIPYSSNELDIIHDENKERPYIQNSDTLHQYKDGLVNVGDFHKNFICIGTLGKAYLLKMDL